VPSRFSAGPSSDITRLAVGVAHELVLVDGGGGDRNRRGLYKTYAACGEEEESHDTYESTGLVHKLVSIRRSS